MKRPSWVTPLGKTSSASLYSSADFWCRSSSSSPIVACRLCVTSNPSLRCWRRGLSWCLTGYSGPPRRRAPATNRGRRVDLDAHTWRIGDREFRATQAGYSQLLNWLPQFGVVSALGAEPNASYGLG